MDGGRYCAICADEDDDPDPFTDLPWGFCTASDGFQLSSVAVMSSIWTV